MQNKGKNAALSVPEMLQGMTEDKERQLEGKRGINLYKVQSDKHKADELKKLIDGSLQDVYNFATTEQISLDDIDELKKRTLIYLKCCSETGTFPNNLGLAHSIGYSDRALRVWRNKYPNSPTGRWLQMFSETCANILSQSALKNNANSVVSIFLSKAFFDMRETSEIVISPAQPDDETKYDVDAIRRRYLTE